MSNPAEAAEKWPAGADLDRAMESAFHAAGRRHRAANESMVMWENGESRHVSPFEIPLPGEDLPRAQPRAPGSVVDVPKRRASGGD